MTGPRDHTINDASRQRSGKSLSKSALLGFILGAGGIATLVVSGIGYRLDWWPVLTALQISEGAAYAAALGLFLSLVGAVVSRPGARQRGLVLSLLGLAASLPIVALAVHWEYATRTYPPINDISTDINEPPVFWDMPNPTEYPGGNSATLQHAAYPDLVSLELTVTADEAYALAIALVREKGWEILANEPSDGRIEAVASSLLYGFKDEIIIRIQDADRGAIVDVRSRSRIGRIDRGVNAKRIRSLLANMKERAGSAKE